MTRENIVETPLNIGLAAMLIVAVFGLFLPVKYVVGLGIAAAVLPVITVILYFLIPKK